MLKTSPLNIVETKVICNLAPVIASRVLTLDSSQRCKHPIFRKRNTQYVLKVFQESSKTLLIICIKLMHHKKDLKKSL